MKRGTDSNNIQIQLFLHLILTQTNKQKSYFQRRQINLKKRNIK